MTKNKVFIAISYSFEAEDRPSITTCSNFLVLDEANRLVGISEELTQLGYIIDVSCWSLRLCLFRKNVIAY
jgi:hypothetical protein